MPSEKYADLRMMLLIGHGTLCVIDGGDAIIKSGGNAVAFVLRLNIIGWARFIVLVFKELKIRYGNQVIEAFKYFLDEMWMILNISERKMLYEYYAKVEALDKQLNIMLSEFIDMINREYMIMHRELDNSLNEDINHLDRLNHSTKFAELSGVQNDEIIRNKEDLYKYFED